MKMKGSTRLRRVGATLALLAFCLFTAPQVQGGPETTPSSPAGEKIITVILVRHAEKDTAPPEDPALSEAGKARAQALAHIAGKANVKAIYTTQFARTRQTAEPLAKMMGITAVPLPVRLDPANPRKISEQSLKEVTDRIRKHEGETVMVVGHSNTIPDIIKALGGATAPEIDEKEFDNLFVVTVFGSGATSVLQLKYGNPL